MSSQPASKAGEPTAGQSANDSGWRKWAAILSVLVTITVLLKWVYGVSSWQDACSRWLWCTAPLPLPVSTTVFPAAFDVANGPGHGIEYTAVVRPESWQTSGITTCIHVSCSATITATYQNLAGTIGDAHAKVLRYKDASTAGSVVNWLYSVDQPGVNSPAFISKGDYLVEVSSCCWQIDWSKGIDTDEWLVNQSLMNLIFASLPS